MYKVPNKTADKTSNTISNGTEFFYMDVYNNFFEIKESHITKKTNNPLYNTLEPLYSNVSTRLHCLSLYVFLYM